MCHIHCCSNRWPCSEVGKSAEQTTVTDFSLFLGHRWVPLTLTVKYCVTEVAWTGGAFSAAQKGQKEKGNYKSTCYFSTEDSTMDLSIHKPYLLQTSVRYRISESGRSTNRMHTFCILAILFVNRLLHDVQERCQSMQNPWNGRLKVILAFCSWCIQNIFLISPLLSACLNIFLYMLFIIPYSGHICLVFLLFLSSFQQNWSFEEMLFQQSLLCLKFIIELAWSALLQLSHCYKKCNTF